MPESNLRRKITFLPTFYPRNIIHAFGIEPCCAPLAGNEVTVRVRPHLNQVTEFSINECCGRRVRQGGTYDVKQDGTSSRYR
jgi:hypothetical protein